MYYRRRSYRKPRYQRSFRKRNYRKKFNRRYRTSRRGQRLYLYKRFCDYGELTISNAVNTYAAYNFSLSDLPNYTEFTSLYDMYKVNAVKITFIPQVTQSVSSGTVNNPNASSRFFSAIDYNDGTAPTSLDDLRQYQTCRMTPILRQHRRFIMKPKILDSNGFSISPWMTTASATANYYGLKIAVEPMDSTSTTTMMYTIEAKFYLSFKQVK